MKHEELQFQIAAEELYKKKDAANSVCALKAILQLLSGQYSCDPEQCLQDLGHFDHDFPRALTYRLFNLQSGFEHFFAFFAGVKDAEVVAAKFSV